MGSFLEVMTVGLNLRTTFSPSSASGAVRHEDVKVVAAAHHRLETTAAVEVRIKLAVMFSRSVDCQQRQTSQGLRKDER
jgi:hypothetical protein